MCTIKQVSLDSELLKTLFEQLDRELCERYAKPQLHSHAQNQLSEGSIAWVIWLDGIAAGCGAYRPLADLPDGVEIKRMFVRLELRGKGLGKRLLDRIETHAAENGYLRTRLETGVAQPEAIALYERQGYIRIPNYPPYTGRSSSVCMEKWLS